MNSKERAAFQRLRDALLAASAAVADLLGDEQKPAEKRRPVRPAYVPGIVEYGPGEDPVQAMAKANAALRRMGVR